jgi:hypothetical protein
MPALGQQHVAAWEAANCALHLDDLGLLQCSYFADAQPKYQATASATRAGEDVVLACVVFLREAPGLSQETELYILVPGLLGFGASFCAFCYRSGFSTAQKLQSEQTHTHASPAASRMQRHVKSMFKTRQPKRQKSLLQHPATHMAAPMACEARFLLIG